MKRIVKVPVPQVKLAEVPVPEMLSVEVEIVEVPVPEMLSVEVEIVDGELSDEEAAHLYRLEQAKDLIRAIQISVPSSDGKKALRPKRPGLHRAAKRRVRTSSRLEG
ncbi:MAG TPA: hypothetical protein VHL58_01535 [Thermoanaerobaculia bacterium]|nr:hypothetical protein [Thermoanaerobaculia bacterium]